MHRSPLYRSNRPSIAAIGALVTLLAAGSADARAATPDGTLAVQPRYEADHLLLPDDWRSWVFVGASLGLSYSEGSGGTEMFHETLMEPTAYQHFARTGEFREGTMLALLLQGLGENSLPQRRGHFAAELHAIELAVKDSSRAETGWSYYGFGSPSGLRERAPAVTSSSCAECHAREAAHDNVFLQFYPLLAEAAPTGTVFRTAVGRQTGIAPSLWAPTEARLDTERQPEGGAESDDEVAAALPVAVAGFDPVLLVEGRDELGKPEIVVDFRGWRYHFASEPTRALFAAEPERYAYQNESCPVVPGASIDPDHFALHEDRIYGFATPDCVRDFEADPDRFLRSGDDGPDDDTDTGDGAPSRDA